MKKEIARQGLPRFTRALPFLAGGLLFACGAPSDIVGTSLSNDTAAHDELTLDASSDTKDAIGVTRWGATHTDATTTVHGYDEANHVLVTLTHTVTNISSAESTIKDTVTGTLGSAALAVQTTAGEPDADGKIEVTTTVTKNTFHDGSGPAKVLAAALADQGADANWTEAKAAGAALSTASLHVDDVALSSSSSSGSSSLTSSSSGNGRSSALTKCVGMTVSCVKSIADAVAGGFKAAQSCSGLATDVSQTVSCAMDTNSGKTNVATGGLRGPVLRGAKCEPPSKDATSQAASTCVEAATDAVKGGADSVNACAQIAGCDDGHDGNGESSSSSSSSGALPPAGS